MTSLVGLDKSLGLVKVILGFMNFCFKYIKNGSVKGLVIYLKACSVILQQASGNHKLQSMNGLNVRFARTHKGYPRIIPMLHRARLHEPKIFRLWMTLFAIYRVLEMPGKLKLTTITTPSAMVSDMLPKFQQFLTVDFWPALSKLPGFDETKMGDNFGDPTGYVKSLRAHPFLISKASSSAGWIPLPGEDRVSVLSTSPASILAAVAAWKQHPHLLQSLTDWCQLTGNT
jgi:hypothetical protein